MAFNSKVELREFEGFEIKDRISAGAQGEVFLCTYQEGQFAVKLVKKESFNTGLSTRFRGEVGAIVRINHPAVLKIFESGEVDNYYYLVTEYIEGKTLKQRIEEGHIHAEELLNIVYQITSGLHQLHKKGLVHRDLKPENIMIDESGQAKLIDFGFALQNETGQEIENFVVGTLDYCSPEQLGIINRPTDIRSDLFSAGVTIFEMLTGSKPFRADSLSDIIDKHIKNRPKPVHEIVEGVDQRLSDLTMKLLAQDPDERFQSPKELLAELSSLLNQKSDMDSHIVPDVPVHLPSSSQEWNDLESTFPPGRTAETEQIREAWRSFDAKSREALLVRGASGQGKSYLLSSFFDALSVKYYCLSAKCQANEEVPYSFFSRAIMGMLDKFRSDPVLRSIHERSAQDLGSILEPILPGFSSGVDVLGDHTRTDNQEHVSTALLELLNRFSSQLPSPLVIHCDDVQWIDSASLKLIRRLLDEKCKIRVFVAMTARDDASERVDEIIDAMGSKFHRIVEILPLGFHASQEVIAEELGRRELSKGILEHVYNISQGSPYAIVQYLRSLLDQGALHLKKGVWHLDHRLIEHFDAPSGLKSILNQRLSRIGENANLILRFSAVIGMEFSFKILTSILHPSMDEKLVSGALRECEAQGLIERLGADTYRFSHDSIKEDLLAQIEANDRKKIHAAIASYLNRKELKDARTKLIYAYHCAGGEGEISPLELYSSHLEAGWVALNTYSNDEAFHYLAKAEKALAQIEEKPQGVERLYIGFGQAFRRMGETESAIERYQESLKYVSEPIEEARIRYYLLETYMSIAYFKNQNPLRETEAELGKAMRALGTYLPKSTAMTFIVIIGTIFKIIFLHFTGWRKGTAKAETRDYLLTLSRIYTMGVRSSFSSYNEIRTLDLGLRNYVCQHYLGTSIESVRALACYAGTIDLMGGKGYVKRLLDETLSMARKLNDQVSLSEVMMDLGVVAFVSKNYDRSINYYWDAINTRAQWLAPEYFFGTTFFLEMDLGARGRIVELAQVFSVRDSYVLERGMSSENVECDMLGKGLMMAVFKGNKGEAKRIREEFWNVMKASESIPQVQNDSYWALFVDYIESDELNEDWLDQVLGQFADLRQSYFNSNYDVKRIFAFIAWARFVQWERSGFSERYEKALKKAIQTAKWCSLEPLSKGVLNLLLGRMYCQKNDYSRSLRYLDQAESDCRLAENPWGLYEVLVEKARVYRRTDQESLSLQYVDYAGFLATRENWVNKLVKLSKEFQTSGSLSKVESSLSKSRSRSDIQDVRTEQFSDALLSVAMATTTTVNVEEQARKVLDEVVRVLHAERAMLFIFDEGRDVLLMKSGRDDRGQDLPSDTEFSSSILSLVKDEQKPILMGSSDGVDLTSARSVVANKLKSIMATPLLLHDRFLGIVYADSTVAKGLFSEKSLEIFTGISSYIAISLNNLEMAHVEAERREMNKDLELSAAVQSLFLPSCVEFNKNPYDFAGYYNPASQCGGDWWWYHHHDNGDISIIVADVTGHGAAPAMITAAVASYVQVMSEQEKEIKLDDLLRSMSSLLHERANSEYLMTAFALKVSPRRELIECWNAGAPFGLYLSEDDSDVLGEAGTPIGVTNFVIAKQERTLKRGALIVLTTDGLLELSDKRGPFGYKRILNLLKKSHGLSAKEISLKLAELAATGLEERQSDDHTWVVLKVL